MPIYKPQIPQIVDPAGVAPGIGARTLPVTTDQSRADTAQAAGGKPLVDFAGTSNPYVDCQSIDLLRYVPRFEPGAMRPQGNLTLRPE